MTLLAFHGDKSIKAKYLRRVRSHAKADEIVKGTYWQDGKGCAVGCTLHGDRHSDYEVELGIPEMLALLEDTIFEGLPNGTAKKFPVRFLKAAKPGADLSRVGWKFLHWLLTKELAGRDHETVRAAVEQCAAVLVPLTEGRTVDESAAWAAESAAWAARLAESAESAAWAAAWAARLARSAAESAAYIRMADKLIELMEAA